MLLKSLLLIGVITHTTMS